MGFKHICKNLNINNTYRYTSRPTSTMALVWIVALSYAVLSNCQTLDNPIPLRPANYWRNPNRIYIWVAVRLVVCSVVTLRWTFGLGLVQYSGIGIVKYSRLSVAWDIYAGLQIMKLVVTQKDFHYNFPMDHAGSSCTNRMDKLTVSYILSNLPDILSSLLNYLTSMYFQSWTKHTKFSQYLKKCVR